MWFELKPFYLNPPPSLRDGNRHGNRPRRAPRPGRRAGGRPFTLDDFMAQVDRVRSLDRDKILKLAGMGAENLRRQIGWMRAIYNSMTRTERENTDLLDGHRRRRIARGAGVGLSEVGQFMKQFENTRRMIGSIGG